MGSPPSVPQNPGIRVARVDIRNGPLPAKHGAGHAGFSCPHGGLFDEVLHAAIALEIRLDVSLGFLARGGRGLKPAKCGNRYERRTDCPALERFKKKGEF